MLLTIQHELLCQSELFYSLDFAISNYSSLHICKYQYGSNIYILPNVLFIQIPASIPQSPYLYVWSYLFSFQIYEKYKWEQRHYFQWEIVGNKVENARKRFQCDACAADFNGTSGLYYHKQGVHKGISFECKECSSRFFKKYDLKIHRQAWHENVRHPCEQCDFKGVYRKDLAQHIKIQHDQRRFNCGECDQSLGRAWHLRRHMGVCTWEQVTHVVMKNVIRVSHFWIIWKGTKY